MIQAIGLTSAPRRNRPLAVDDLTFEARTGEVTVLCGPSGAGKSTALRLMLQLRQGRGVTLFRGRPLHRVPHVSREIGVLLGDVPGHPARTARGHLRMLTAVAGVPPARADEVLEVVGLSGLADQRLGTFSLGMDRRLGLAAALLGDPHTLVLDDPAEGLAPREAAWLRGMLRGYAAEGGLVLTTTSDPREALRVGDRILTVEAGRLLADQDAASFSRTRLRPGVAVASPHAERLGNLLLRESHSRLAVAMRPAYTTEVSPASERIEVVHEGGGRISVYGSSCALVGETAYRHGILVHQLAEHTGEVAPPDEPLTRADGRDGRDVGGVTPQAVCRLEIPQSRSESPPLPPRLRPVPVPGPAWPLRYELRRMSGVRGTWWTAVVGLLLSLLVSCWMGSRTAFDAAHALAGWPVGWSLPPVAAAAGLLGALAFGHEYRFPALAPAQAPVPRRLGLLVAKLTISALSALTLCSVSLLVNASGLMLLYGSVGQWSTQPPTELTLLGTALLAVSSAWVALLAAAVFRSLLAGVASVGAVPLLIEPAVRGFLVLPAADTFVGMSERISTLVLVPLPRVGDDGAETVARLLAQPLGPVMVLSLVGLLGAYVFGTLCGRPR